MSESHHPSSIGRTRPLAFPRLANLAGKTKAFAAKWRTPIFILALLVFGVGCILSFRKLELDLSTLNITPILVMILAAIPLSIVYSAINMVLMGHAAKVTIGFRAGIKISVFSQVAEILPLPGGAIVRTGALIHAGSSSLRSIELVLGFSLLWIASGAVGAGFALLDLGWPAVLLLSGGFAAWLAICVWLGIRFGANIALAAALLRVLGVALVAWRLSLAFAAIGMALPWIESMTFAFATILGSAAAIVPAGLGVSEGLSALIAGPAGVVAAAAFLAAGLNRLLGLATHLAVALGFMLSAKSTTLEAPNA